jgi:hypothetical protein
MRVRRKREVHPVLPCWGKLCRIYEEACGAPKFRCTVEYANCAAGTDESVANLPSERPASENLHSIDQHERSVALEMAAR